MPLDPFARSEPLWGLLAIKATKNGRVQRACACTVFETVAQHHGRFTRIPRTPGLQADRFAQSLNAVVVGQ